MALIDPIQNIITYLKASNGGSNDVYTPTANKIFSPDLEIWNRSNTTELAITLVRGDSGDGKSMLDQTMESVFNFTIWANEPNQLYDLWKKLDGLMDDKHDVDFGSMRVMHSHRDSEPKTSFSFTSSSFSDAKRMRLSTFEIQYKLLLWEHDS